MAETYRALPPQEELKTWFRYDPESGILYRIARKCSGTRRILSLSPERPVGCPLPNKYLVCAVPGLGSTLVSRVIWAIHSGNDPGPMQVDHINGDRQDNRWLNLRLALKRQNMCNQPKHRSMNGKPPSSAFKGVTVCGGRISAQIRTNGKNIHLGDFPTEAAAHAAYCEAAKKYHGEFARLK
jgi:hypothetical protein